MQINVSTLTDEEKEIQRIKDIKKAAGDRINELYPEWKQRNMLAEASSLIRKHQKGQGKPEDENRFNDLDNAWLEIQRIREISDLAEIEGLQAHEIVWET